MTQENRSLWEGCDVLKLTESIPTPFFLFSKQAIASNINRLQNAFSMHTEKFRIDYCVKSNYEFMLLEVIRTHGIGAMVTCPWELRLAKEVGFKPDSITYHGPCKSYDELKFAIESEIGLIHVYNHYELDMIQQIARDMEKTVRISLRIVAPRSRRQFSIPKWYAGRFGFSHNEILDIFGMSKNHPSVIITGLGFHLGTQMVDPGDYFFAIKKLFCLIKEVYGLGYDIQEITLGGGWPSDNIKPVNFKSLLKAFFVNEDTGCLNASKVHAENVARFICKTAREKGISSIPSVRLEPGRGIIGSAGILVTRVVRKKGNWIFVDAGRNYLPESLLFARRRIMQLAKRAAKTHCLYNISGNTLNTMDVMAVGVKLPGVEIGDVLIFMDAGAYTLSRSVRYAGSAPNAFLSDEDCRIVQIRREETLEDITLPMVKAAERFSILE
ncbi:MAG TPA: hypothetical protein DHV16_02075 [Nitrospiraceae bacterium]|nr:MAG: hypothetical protein A2Z82_08020 [Nitrospirae bacterium GWA2_46_11]OGW23588.1 MAG: hypothetical protein A2X55_01015 [Nitrospirae bacterium GWB2_47_37]HAK88619.1 hypothetical protein [Nitrospiraceae bacterium]HCZ11049.1 hypothetical protein [Nitrospiraceae bacterium]